jgi:hypothetical protein
MVKLLVLGAVALLLIFGGASWYRNHQNAAHTVKNIVNVKFYSTKDECEQKTKAICSQPVCEAGGNQVTDKICGNKDYHNGVWAPSGY